MPAPARIPAKITVDFSNVEDRREAIRVPEGDYLFQVTNCELRGKKDDPSSKYLNWSLTIVEPTKFKGKGPLYMVTSLKPEALWKLRNFLVDMGVNVPKTSVDIPIAQIVSKKPMVGGTVGDDEYENKVRSKIGATFSKADWTAMSTGETTATEDEEEAETADEDLEELDVDDL